MFKTGVFPYYSALLFVVAIILQVPTTNATGTFCNINNGPAGAAGCMSDRIPRYLSRQYATCVSSVYVRQISKGHHQCEDQTAAYCHYQCMLEVHDVNSGQVTPDCACDSNSTTYWQNATALDLQCYSPSGAECTWFANCLQKEFRCEGTEDSYVISYAENFCTMFMEKRGNLSAKGQQWMDAARKCLQVQLVPVLRQFALFACSSIKQRALRSHAACYLQPFINEPSVCDLPPSDFWAIFWTIKSAFKTDFQESLLGVLKVAQGCGSRVLSFTSNAVRQLVFNIALPVSRIFARSTTPLPPTTGRQRREVVRVDRAVSGTGDSTLRRTVNVATRLDTDARAEQQHHQDHARRVIRETSNTWQGETEAEMYYHRLAEQAASQMARRLGWKESGVTWFAYGKLTGNNTLEVRILLADEQAFGLDNKTRPVPLNMSDVVEQAAQAFGDGQIIITVDGTRVQPQTFSACGDIDCNQVYLNTTAPPIPPIPTTLHDGHEMARSALSAALVAGFVSFRIL